MADACKITGACDVGSVVGWLGGWVVGWLGATRKHGRLGGPHRVARCTVLTNGDCDCDCDCAVTVL